ncbi:MAG: sulfotransferase family protein, partial [Planctomycetota bacterium]
MKKPDHRTSTDYRRPYRPKAVRMINLTGRVFETFNLRSSLSEESLLKAAKKTNKLDDFGDESFRKPLGVLLDSIERESELTPAGRFITRKRLIGVLGNRLRARKFFTDYPEILRQKVARPVIITGLQRTGTTLLHRMMAADPDTRSLRSWEAVNPAPFLNVKNGKKDPRVGMAELSAKVVSYLSPDFYAVHPIEVHSQEEDVLLLDFSFLSTVPESLLRVPAYSRWLEEQDYTPAYKYMKDLLKLLQWQRPGSRWVLKTPHHLEHIETLCVVFPDAKFVQLHRDPCTALASFCSMIAHSRGVLSDTVDPVEIGRHWLRKTGRMIDASMIARATSLNDRFIDVYYYDLVRDPVGEIKKIYGFLGIPFSEKTAETMEKARQLNIRY